jgi:glutathione S-transferase
MQRASDIPGLRLLTIPISHYCEKARWALQRAHLDYVEVRHIQLFHYASTLWHARSAYVPVLLTAEGPIRQSTDILHYADRHGHADEPLFPHDPESKRRVMEWAALFDRVIGVESRRWLYQVGFEQLGTKGMLELAAQGTPRWQAPLARLLMPLARRYLSVRLDITPERVERGLRDLRQVFERVGRELADGRSYLVGARFSAADLTFAALSAFLLMPPEYGVRLPPIVELPSAMRATVEEFRATRAGEFALHLFERERWRHQGLEPTEANRTERLSSAPLQCSPS